jgi:hypothetical protein
VYQLKLFFSSSKNNSAVFDNMVLLGHIIFMGDEICGEISLKSKSLSLLVSINLSRQKAYPNPSLTKILAL